MNSISMCPILSIGRHEGQPRELCVGEQCALYLPQVQKCSLVYIGFKALMDMQKPAAAPPPPPAAHYPPQGAPPQQAMAGAHPAGYPPQGAPQQAPMGPR